MTSVAVLSHEGLCGSQHVVGAVTAPPLSLPYPASSPPRVTSVLSHDEDVSEGSRQLLQPVPRFGPEVSSWVGSGSAL